MPAKKYKVSLSPFYADCEIEINEEHIISEGYTCKDAIKDMVGFHVGDDDILSECDGDYTKAFLKKLARKIFQAAISTNLNEVGIASEIEEHEGYCKMDGSKGIKILSVDDCDISTDELEIQEIQ